MHVHLKILYNYRSNYNYTSILPALNNRGLLHKSKLCSYIYSWIFFWTDWSYQLILAIDKLLYGISSRSLDLKLHWGIDLALLHWKFQALIITNMLLSFIYSASFRSYIITVPSQMDSLCIDPYVWPAETNLNLRCLWCSYN